VKEVSKYIITEPHGGSLLKDFLRGSLQFSRRSIINLKKRGGVTLNGSSCHMNRVLEEGDIVEVCFQDTQSENIQPEPTELDVIYEDDSLIVLNKPPNMPVHPSRNHLTGTLANGLAHYWLQKGEQRKIRPINRLDKDTSGLVIFAKNAHTQHLLSFCVGTEAFKKEYLAVVEGVLCPREATIELPIARESKYSMTRVVREDGDRAVTHYSTIKTFQDYSVAGIILETGRTHQIRVHMAHVGHPLLGDALYGGRTELIQRQALHAVKMTLLHPVTKKWHCFTAPVPEDINKLL
jgi:23S rRNA pseudouridine1911/1915/1917 synthase